MPVKDPNAKNKTINDKDGVFLEALLVVYQ